MARSVSGLKSRPYMNLFPVERMASRFGGLGIRSGAYGRSAAQYAAPIQAHMTARRAAGAQESAFSKFFRDQERQRMEQERQIKGLQGAGGIAGDLAEYLAGRKPAQQQMSPQDIEAAERKHRLDRELALQAEWERQQRGVTQAGQSRRRGVEEALQRAYERRGGGASRGAPVSAGQRSLYQELVGGQAGEDYGEGLMSAALLRRLLGRGRL